MNWTGWMDRGERPARHEQFCPGDVVRFETTRLIRCGSNIFDQDVELAPEGSVAVVLIGPNVPRYSTTGSFSVYHYIVVGAFGIGQISVPKDCVEEFPIVRLVK